MGPVVVGVSRSEAGLSAVDLAAEEAAARLTPLLIVRGHPGGTDRLPADHDLLELAVSRALADHPWLAVSGKLALGDPARVLTAQSTRACVLVVGHQPASGRPALSAGSVAAQVMLGSSCPVIAHRPMDPERQSEQANPVLLGVTRHGRAEPVVEFAFEEASLRGAALLAMHVWPEEDEAARLLDEALASWSGKFPEVPVIRRVWPGYDVARALCGASRDAQLMVVGLGPQTGRTRLMRGLLVQDLIDFAGCPVAVVPHV
jgi:nucleotide-binding universal stress UspA family protein